jgi:dephospho-CoA kinase
MLKVALTGGIATGKSYVLEQFRRRGVPCLDADVLAHGVEAAGTEATAAIVMGLRAFELVGNDPFAVVDVPLLYETGAEKNFDRVIATTCPPEMQLARLLERGLTEAAAHQRLAAQWPTEKKASRADFVIGTSGTFGDTDTQVDYVLRQILR